jgi:hypothetical protein
MAAIEIRGMDELLRGLNDLQKQQLPGALAKTLTELAFVAKNKVVVEMQTVFDRPTPFTLNSMNVVKATISEMRSKVTPKDPLRINPDQHYLNPQVEGGRRWFKKFEARLYKIGILPAGYFTVPSTAGAKIDDYGNMSKGQIVQILAYFDAFPEAGFRSNMGGAGRSRLARGTRNQLGYAYFSVQPNSRSRLHPGIYMRINLHDGSGQGAATVIRPVLLFVRTANYRKRLNIERIAQETYDRYFDMYFTSNLRHAVNTAMNR